VSDLVINILSSVTVSSAFVAALVFLSRSWFSAKLKNSIKHEYDQKLEAYKSQLKYEQEIAILQIKSLIEKESVVQQAGHSSLHQVQKASIDKKLISIERVWEAIVKARNETPAVIIFLDVLTVDEYPTLVSNSDSRSLIEQLNPEKIGEIANSFAPDVENVRPYIGEYLWSIFFAYRAVTIRTLFLMHKGLNDPKKLNWHEDKGILSLMSSVLTENQMQRFNRLQFGKFNLFRELFEGLMLATMSKVISGEKFSSEMISQAKIITEKASELSNKKPNKES